jgi:hypothetical protein
MPHLDSNSAGLQNQPAAAIVRAMRGFAFIFWGLPLTLLLYFRALDIRTMESLHLPSYILGMGIIYVGFVFVLHCGIGSAKWKRYARHGLISSFMLIYLGPFVYWYRYIPRIGAYYMANSVILIACIIWLLFTINWLASELGHLVGDETLKQESRLFGWSVGLMMLVPLLITFAFSSVMAVKFESSLISEMRVVRYDAPTWTQILFLLPISLTMMSAWKGKEQCLHILREATLGADDS